MLDLVSLITQIRQKLVENAYPDEVAVRSQIVVPILQALGWSTWDPDKVSLEYKLKHKQFTRRVDLALIVNAGSPRCIIELKSTSYNLKQIGRSDGDLQLFEYAFHAGAPLALLTNGLEWRFYSILSPGSYEERLVRVLKIDEQSPEEFSNVLARYLSYEKTESGSSAEAALADLTKRIAQSAARKVIPQAWKRLVSGSSNRHLVDLLVAEVSSLTNEAPAESDIVEFLRGLNHAAWRPTPDTTQVPIGDRLQGVPQGQHGDPSASGSKVAKSRKATETRKVAYHFLGERQVAGSAKEAYVQILNALAARDPDFLNRLEPKLKGHKNRGLARSRDEISNQQVTRERAVQISGGWWLHTHMSNKQKANSLRSACTVAGILFGDRSGLNIRLPNS